MSFPKFYDPVGPFRSPLSKRSVAAVTADMAGVIAALAVNDRDGCVTKDDLHRAGFSNGEIDRCHVDAVNMASESLRPRQVKRRAA